MSELSEKRFRLTRQTAVVGAITNLVLTIVKIAAGWLGQSQSLVADGVHSLSDLLSDGLVYYAARHAKEDPDEGHPYGHGRFETAGTVALGVFLMLIGFEIIWDSGSRLFKPESLLKPEFYTIYFVILSIISKEALFYYTRHVGRKIKSQLVLANAWHHRTDSISSVIVLVGLVGTMAGLPYLDAIAAVLVGLMIVHVGWQLGWGAMQELMDAALEAEQVKEIRDVINSVAGVSNIHMLRTRRLGGHASADVHVQVDPHLSVSEGHRIAEVVQQRLIDEVEMITDVIVHIDPEDDQEVAPCSRLPLRRDVLALLDDKWKHVACYQNKYKVVLHYLSGGIEVELFLPLNCYESVDQARQLYAAFHSAVSKVSSIRGVALWFGERKISA